jgi:hypothetical protein
MPRAERRKAVRYAVKRCTAYFRRRRMWFLFEKEKHHAPVLDMSSRGIGFLTKRSVVPGDIVEVSFDLPFEVYAIPLGFKLKARVECVMPAPGEAGLRRVGCSFPNLRDDQVELVTRIIRYGILRER